MNSILYFSESIDNEIYVKYLKNLILLNCEAIQIRCSENSNIDQLKILLTEISKSKIHTIEIFISSRNIISNKHLIKLCEIIPQIRLVCIYNSYKNEVIKLPERGFGMIISSMDNLYNEMQCGSICQNQFIINEGVYTESQEHNTCLNRKISIDANGEIKNCPSMSKSYGNIRDTTLSEAIEKPGFKDMWFINKDKIHVCKDCEFRHICTDCRAYIENPEDIYSKPLKCGYNPYTAEWEEWSINPLKQKAIEYYGMQELIKKGS